MPSKLKAYLQNYRSGQQQSLRLPTINNPLLSNEKQLMRHKVEELKKQQVSKSNLTYSRNIKIQNPARLLYNVRRIQTQQSSQDLKNLSKIEQNIMMQIKNIDVCLQSQRNQQKQKQKTALFNGYIFLNEVNEFVVDNFYQCLQIQSEASHAIIDGFEVHRIVTGINGEPDVFDANIVKKVTSMNNKLLDKSIKAIQQYDKQKNNQYEKKYGKQWSWFKRDLSIMHQSPQKQQSRSIFNREKNDSKITFIKSFKSQIQNDSKSTNLFESKVTSHSKNSFVNDFSFIKRSRGTNISAHLSTGIKTQPTENQQSQQKMIVKLTKKEVRMMLTRHKNIISIWIPPASYPQFFGIFSYKIIKTHKQDSVPLQTIYKCKINRYFFYKFGLSRKVFDAILQWASYQNNLIIESLEITMQKSIYSSLFVKMGWILKFWQSANKVKVCYYAKNKQQKHEGTF